MSPIGSLQRKTSSNAWRERMEEEEQVWVAGLGGSAPAFEAWQVASGKAIVVVRCTAAS